jgi:hypothetical protein
VYRARPQVLLAWLRDFSAEFELHFMPSWRKSTRAKDAVFVALPIVAKSPASLR